MPRQLLDCAVAAIATARSITVREAAILFSERQGIALIASAKQVFCCDVLSGGHVLQPRASLKPG